MEDFVINVNEDEQMAKDPLAPLAASDPLASGFDDAI